MTGAIFYSGQYGSTAQYADWIADATGLPVFNINDSYADPTKFDFLVLGSSVILYKLTIRKWVEKHLDEIEGMPVILYSVSGAPAGPKLDGWIADSLPKSFIARLQFVALQGRLDINNLNWWMRLFMRVGSWLSNDPEVKKHELKGFDFMDKSSIEPIVQMVRKLQPADNEPAKAA